MAEIDQGQLKGAFDSLLGYIDKPWKVLAILVLAIAGFVGYFIYTNQSFLIAAYEKNHAQPKINLSRSDDAANILFKETGADVVAIFSVDSILGKRVAQRVYSKTGRNKEFDGENVGLFTSNADNNYDITRLMAGEIPCSNYRRAQSEIGLWYLRQGVTFTCRVSIPPEINLFIGQITLGWKEPPADIEKAHGIMVLTAKMLVK